MTLPDNGILSKYFSNILAKEGAPIKIVSRKEFPDNSTFPVELITCKTNHNGIITLFCKYLGGLQQNNFEFTNKLAYEAKLYAEVLEEISLSKVTYYGYTEFLDLRLAVIVLGYLGDNLRINYSTDTNVLAKAAEWIARFHGLFSSRQPASIKIYDEQYYTSWLTRFEKLFYSDREKHPDVTDIIQYFNNNIELLISKSQTIVHGEYYPKNILIKDGLIYPVDWECAAISAGEIDLASLIEGWDQELAENAKKVYVGIRERLEEDYAIDFERRLLMAQLFLFFRWWPENVQKLSPGVQRHLMNHLNFLKEKVYADEVYNS